MKHNFGVMAKDKRVKLSRLPDTIKDGRQLYHWYALTMEDNEVMLRITPTGVCHVYYNGRRIR